jgi:hypothetical protein
VLCPVPGNGAPFDQKQLPVSQAHAPEQHTPPRHGQRPSKSHEASHVKTVPQLSVAVPEQALPQGFPVETHVEGGGITAASLSAPALSQAVMSLLAASLGTGMSNGMGPFGFTQRRGESAGSPSGEAAGLLGVTRPRATSS